MKPTKNAFICFRVTSDEKKEIQERMSELRIKSFTEFFRYLWNRFGKET